MLRCKPAVQEPVVHVTAVGAENGLPADEAACDGQRHVENWDKHGHQGRDHAKNRGGLEAPDNPEAAKQKSKQQTSGIAKKGSCRIEVVT